MRGWFGERVVEVTAATDRPVSENRPPEPAPESVSRPADPDAAEAEIAARLRSRPESRCRQPAGGNRAEPACSRRTWRPVRRRTRRRAATDAAVRHALESGCSGWPRRKKPRARRGVRRAARRGQDHDHREDRGAGARAARSRLGLVSADGYRVGAVEQLRLYADIIGAPFRVARSAEELERRAGRRAAARCSWTRPAGRPATARPARAVQRVRRAGRSVRTHLVVPARDVARRVRRTASTPTPAREPAPRRPHEARRSRRPRRRSSACCGSATCPCRISAPASACPRTSNRATAGTVLAALRARRRQRRAREAGHERDSARSDGAARAGRSPSP